MPEAANLFTSSSSCQDRHLLEAVEALRNTESDLFEQVFCVKKEPEELLRAVEALFDKNAILFEKVFCVKKKPEELLKAMEALFEKNAILFKEVFLSESNIVVPEEVLAAQHWLLISNPHKGMAVTSLQLFTQWLSDIKSFENISDLTTLLAWVQGCAAFKSAVSPQDYQTCAVHHLSTLLKHTECTHFMQRLEDEGVGSMVPSFGILMSGVPAVYGRYNTADISALWGFNVNGRAAWVLQELPNLGLLNLILLSLLSPEKQNQELNDLGILDKAVQSNLMWWTELIANDFVTRLYPDYSHPKLWAPFMMMGSVSFM
jgi:hypothetical protein